MRVAIIYLDDQKTRGRGEPKFNKNGGKGLSSTRRGFAGVERGDYARSHNEGKDEGKWSCVDQITYGGCCKQQLHNDTLGLIAPLKRGQLPVPAVNRTSKPGRDYLS